MPLTKNLARGTCPGKEEDQTWTAANGEKNVSREINEGKFLEKLGEALCFLSYTDVNR
ncbi:MAG: hypothetical protein M0P97_04015 [Candidatus Moranbacteria bacterium]|jgi:hypothetical protein|nr:hypothetical protein [Candidatus Moranbacteria bacterium]